MGTTFWATRVVNGVKQRKEFGRIQWDMIRTKNGEHDGWVMEDANAPEQSEEVKKPFIPKEIASRNPNLPQAEKDALDALDKSINGDKEATDVQDGERSDAAGSAETPVELKKEDAEKKKEKDKASLEKFNNSKKKVK